MSEKTLFEGDEVLVTDKRTVIRGNTYPMANITSVSMRQTDTTVWKGAWWALIIAGAVLVIGGIGGVIAAGVAAHAVSDKGFDMALSVFGTFALVGGLLPTIFGVPAILSGRWALSKMPTGYTVRITDASGTVSALTHPDEEFVERVVDAMNQAFIERQ